MSFEQAIAFTLKWEGVSKYTNDPVDPGGETKYGISKRAYPDLDIRNLTEEEAHAIYHRDYWKAAGCDELSEVMGMCVFDAAVNCGVSRASKWLDASRGEPEVFQHLRYRYYIDLVNAKPKFVKYIKGWTNRLNDLNKVTGLKGEDDGLQEKGR